MEIIKKYFTLRELIIAAFFLGGYYIQFDYMKDQLSDLASKVDILQAQSSSQEQQLNDLVDSVHWLRDRN